MRERSKVRRLTRFVMRGGRRRKGAAGPLESPPALVLFDFDGTLADTFDEALAILNRLAGEFGFRELLPGEIAGARDLSTKGLMKLLGIPRMKLPRIAARGTEEMSRTIDTIQPCEGVPELVRGLWAAGHRLGVLTSNSEENVLAFLGNHGLDVFEFVKSSSKLLGKGAVLRRLMRDEGLGPRQILFIGDETRDIEAAHETGVHMAAVTWGYNSRKALEACAPDHVFDTPGEVGGLLEGLRGGVR
jgi:phosphoglycolate phosphatase